MSQEQPRRLGTGLGLFAGIGAVLSFFLMLPLGMASDPCGQGNPQFRCSATGEWLLPALPWLALAAGVVLTVLAALARRWPLGLAAAVVIYLAAVALAFGLA